jgi:serine protease Do
MAEPTENKITKQTTDPIGEHSVSTTPGTRRSKSYTFTVPDFRPTLPASSRFRFGALAVIFILLGVLSGLFGGYLETHNNSTGDIGASLSNQEKVVSSQSQLTNQIAKTVGPSVVSVNVDITSGGGSSTSGSDSSDGFGLYGFSQPEDEEAAGTGIIISSNGIIMTNRHVVPVGTTSVSITLSNGTELKDVSVIGRTSQSDSLDLAFLKVHNLEGQKLTPAVIGDSSDVQVGDDVVAIGNALGQFQNTVTSGIISGYGRSVQASADTSGGSSSESLGGSDTSTSDTENLDDLFQTDAAINEGNSGGPLVNLNGQVIGINTAIAGDAQNIGFAIPINDAKGLIEQVLKTGTFKVPYLGVRYIPLTADVADEYNLSVQNGAFIAPSSDASEPSVVPGSPANSAGLQTNDVITQVNGTSINSTHSLTSLLDEYQPGTNVNLTVVRDGKTMKIPVTLGTAPNN